MAFQTILLDFMVQF